MSRGKKYILNAQIFARSRDGVMSAVQFFFGRTFILKALIATKESSLSVTSLERKKPLLGRNEVTR